MTRPIGLARSEALKPSMARRAAPVAVVNSEIQPVMARAVLRTPKATAAEPMAMAHALISSLFSLIQFTRSRIAGIISSLAQTTRRSKTGMRLLPISALRLVHSDLRIRCELARLSEVLAKSP